MKKYFPADFLNFLCKDKKSPELVSILKLSATTTLEARSREQMQLSDKFYEEIDKEERGVINAFNPLFQGLLRFLTKDNPTSGCGIIQNVSDIQVSEVSRSACITLVKIDCVAEAHVSESD